MWRSRSVTEERGDESRPRDKTQHGARGLLPGPQKQRFLFSSTKWRHVIYGQPASVWSRERHRFMSAIMSCPCNRGKNLEGGVCWLQWLWWWGWDGGLQPLRAGPSGRKYIVSIPCWLWICDTVARGWGVALRCISQADVGLQAAWGWGGVWKESSAGGGWDRELDTCTHTHTKVWYTNW